MKDFPFEALVKIAQEDFFVGRIIINKVKTEYTAEIDIINKESRKIYRHVDNLYGGGDPKETLDQAVQKLAEFLGHGGQCLH